MAAANTDLLKKYKSLFSTTLSTGIGTGTGDTITPATVTGLPTDTAIILTFDRVDSSGVATPSKLERIIGVVSGGNLTSYVRAKDSTTEQAHSSGAVIEMVWNAQDWNDMVDWGLQDHDQSGYHKTLTDANGNEWIKQTATASAVNEITVANAATGNAPSIVATGEDTNISLLNKGKGTGVVKDDGDTIEIIVTDFTTDLATGDGQAYVTIPSKLNEMNLDAVHARVITAGTTNTTDIQIHNVTDSQDMLSTKLTIDSEETGSDTAATPAVINTSYDDVATNDLLRIDIDQVSTTEPQGLIVRLEFRNP